MTTRIHVWYEPEQSGWFWDDAEDHGGYDRISPVGPFDTRAEAEADASSVLFALYSTEIVEGRPSYYD